MHKVTVDVNIRMWIEMNKNKELKELANEMAFTFKGNSSNVEVVGTQLEMTVKTQLMLDIDNISNSDELDNLLTEDFEISFAKETGLNVEDYEILDYTVVGIDID